MDAIAKLRAGTLTLLEEWTDGGVVATTVFLNTKEPFFFIQSRHFQPDAEPFGTQNYGFCSIIG